jgi:benzoylformate decarboxylase
LKDLGDALEAELPASARDVAKKRAAAVAEARVRQREAFEKRARETWNMAPLSVERLMVELAQAMPEDTIVTEEAITSRGPLMQAMEFTKPGDYYGSRGGGLGWGMPGPLGVKLACPTRPVVAVVGDGSAMYTIQALWTAARYNIPVVYVICNNRSYKILKEGMVRYLAGSGRESQYVGLSFYEKPIEAARIAESFDLLGIRVDRPEQLRPALDRAFACGKAAVVDVSIQETLDVKAIQDEWLSWRKP